MKFRKKPIEIEATQWHKNGDHPLDGPAWDPETKRPIEGAVVRFFRPDVSGNDIHPTCGYVMERHGWIDTLEGSHAVCPGDWIITGIAGERYPCKPGIFAATYDPVPERRLLKVGHVLVSAPCVITVTDVGTSDVALAHCDHCHREHVLDRRMYEDGLGPWKKPS